MVPNGRFAGICDVESGKAAPFVGGPPGVELHTVVEGLPSRDGGDMVPVVLPTRGVAMVPNGAVDVVAVDDIVVAVLPADVDGVVPVVPPVADIAVTVTVGVAGAICPDGVEQITTVPGVVGSEASGSGASVVAGAPGWVAAENGPGPLSGEDSIVPGVDGRPMAVVPMVETCARLASQPNSRAAAVNNKRRIAITSSGPI
ncbi:hypothetical protein SAMN05444159_0820 [Bradyrhizobium lablabi]|uniref:Uncharacterized protein n=1 Tax=Bradyrhizobium lablabi TaxID=722472 RepID=A0A1M6JZ19_9BRAD|nr:hypothetical protein SAMN05444159_0820 [Bradyrhizobium lablabi]